MKHGILASSVICATLVSTLIAQAASPPVENAGDSAQQSATALRLPHGAFRPATISLEYVLNNANQDVTDPRLFPRAYHSTGYHAWGRVTGYFQAAHLKRSGSAGDITFRYAASIFQKVKGARAAWADGSTHIPSKYSGVRSSRCTTGLVAPCIRWFIPRSDTDGYVELFQRNRCLIETDTRAPRAAFTAEKDRMTRILGNIDRMAAQRAETAVCRPASPSPTPTPPPTPLPVSFTFDKLAATGAGGQARTTFRVNEDVRIVAVYTVRNLPAGKVLNGSIVRSFQIPVRGKFQQVTQNSDQLAVGRNGTYQNVHDTGGFSRVGAVRIVTRIQFGKTTHTRHVDLQVK